MFKLSDKSLSKLEGVNPDLVAVVKRAIEITQVDFTVLEGLRSVERQEQLVKQGASKTMNSRHIKGHAVDLGAYVNGAISWDTKYYVKIAEAMMKAADELGVKVEWGGAWKSFHDSPHFELSRKDYPIGK